MFNVQLILQPWVVPHREQSVSIVEIDCSETA